MVGRILWVVSTVLLFHTAQCEGPPKIQGSYMAWGEITAPLPEENGTLEQVVFEESFDSDSQNSALVLWANGENVTFVQNYKTKQTFKYSKLNSEPECSLSEETEWVQSEYPPGLLIYEDDDGRVKFSIRQLLNIPDTYLIENGTDVVFRGIPAKKWSFEINNTDGEIAHDLIIDAYWSDDRTWNTTSSGQSIPLGFKIEKSTAKKDNITQKITVTTEEIVTSVFGFVSGTYNRKHFLPFQGIICANRISTVPFPSVQNIKAISIHSELVLPEYKQIKYIDTYFDPQNELVRIDVERIREEDPEGEEKTKRYESEIAIGQMGVVFRQTVFKDMFKCEIIQFKDYLNDVQNFLDVKQDLKKWKMGKLFGLNDTSYVYTGKAVKRDIPCHVFQGIRNDWPEESAQVTSLWEWCFNANMSKENENVLFLDDQIGLVNVQVKIISSGKPQDYTPGYRMLHHFYEVSPRDPDILDATRFDISRCFKEEQRRHLQFYLKYEIKDSSQLVVVQNLTSDVSFLQKWKASIYLNSGLQEYSLRISNVKSTIVEKKLYIKFTILDIYQAADSASKQKSMADAEKALIENVNKGNVSITHSVKGQENIVFEAEKNSVSAQINPDFIRHTLPPIETTTEIHVKYTKKYTGHQPGAVAAASVSTLLFGIVAGSAGVFYKYYGLPSGLRRS